MGAMIFYKALFKLTCSGNNFYYIRNFSGIQLFTLKSSPHDS